MRKMKKKILFICGSLNQTTMMHKISGHMKEHDCYFTPYYSDGVIGSLVKAGFLKFTILSGKFFEDTVNYLTNNQLRIDYKGKAHNYDLVFTCSDLIVPSNIKNKQVVLVQEGMTDPENLMYYAVKYLGLPRFLASTSTTGLSDSYSLFCVASEGYKNLFIKKGVKKEKLLVTGIPNFDNCKQFLNNDFQLRNYVLVATSDSRETFKYENRKKFIREAVNIAEGKQMIFKLHPNEKVERAVREIKDIVPDAIVLDKGNTNELIANCDTLITKYSSVVYVGLALRKEVYSYFNLEQLKQLTPLQNDGNSACNIATAAIALLEYKTQPQTGKSYSGNNIIKPAFKQSIKKLAGV